MLFRIPICNVKKNNFKECVCYINNHFKEHGNQRWNKMHNKLTIAKILNNLKFKKLTSSEKYNC